MHNYLGKILDIDLGGGNDEEAESPHDSRLGQQVSNTSAGSSGRVRGKNVKV
jgi:hypothetical protein